MKAITLRNIPADTAQEVERKDLDELAGVWSEEEARELDRHLAAQRRIEPELWE